MVDHPNLEHLIALKHLFGGWEALFNLVDGSPIIIQTLGIVSYSGTASRQTDSRTAGLSQPSLTISTLFPSRLSSSSINAAWSTGSPHRSNGRAGRDRSAA